MSIQSRVRQNDFENTETWTLLKHIINCCYCSWLIHIGPTWTFTGRTSLTKLGMDVTHPAQTKHLFKSLLSSTFDQSRNLFFDCVAVIQDNQTMLGRRGGVTDNKHFDANCIQVSSSGNRWVTSDTNKSATIIIKTGRFICEGQFTQNLLKMFC